MITLEEKVSPHPQVVETEVDEGEMVLLHLESKMYYSLNPTGARIWDGLKKGLSLAEVSQQLQETFDVGADRADQSVQELVADLAANDLLEVHKAGE